MDKIDTTEIKQIEVEINFYKGQAVQSIFEIGERLIKAKELVSHGEWESWLSEKVDFSISQAQRFMRVAKEFPKTSTSQYLGQSKIFEMLALPKEERETFIEENPVEEMTTRELRQAIKEKKELEQKVKELEEREPEIVEKTIEKEPSVIEVVPEHIKEKLQQLENDKKELNNLKNAGLSIKEYNKQKLKIDQQVRDRRKEYESLMNTMRRLEESYDKKNERLTVQANLLNKIRMAVKPLKQLNSEIQRLFEVTGELDAISMKEVNSEVDTAYKVLNNIEEQLKIIRVEEVYYEKQ